MGCNEGQVWVPNKDGRTKRSSQIAKKSKQENSHGKSPFKFRQKNIDEQIIVGEYEDAGKSDDSCQKFQTSSHPWFLGISIAFLIITLFVYIAEDSLRLVR